MPLEPGLKLGAFEIAGLLGKGRMGEVYRARDTKLGREVAIKVLPEHFAAVAEACATKMGLLQRPHSRPYCPSCPYRPFLPS